MLSTALRAAPVAADLVLEGPDVDVRGERRAHHGVQEGVEQRGVHHVTQLVRLVRLSPQQAAGPRQSGSVTMACFPVCLFVVTDQRGQVGLEALPVHVGQQWHQLPPQLAASAPCRGRVLPHTPSQRL